MDLPDPAHIYELALDTETSDPDLTTKGPGFVYGTAKVVGISVYTNTGYSEYFPLRHREDNIDWPPVKRWLQTILGNPNVTVVFANAKYDLEALWSLGINVKAWCVDVQVVESLIDEEKKSYSLESLSKDYDLPQKSHDIIEQALILNGYKLKNGKPDWSKIWRLPVPVVAEYAKGDAKTTYDIFQLQKPKIKEEGLTEIFELECELTPVLFDMRINGITVDIAKTEAENSRLFDNGKDMLDDIRSQATNLNPFSSQQLGEVVRSFGIEPPKTEKDNDSVTNEFLLNSDINFLKQIGQYRQQEKIRRDFIEGLVLKGNYKGKVHPQWYQTRGSSFMSDNDVNGTRSGRVACVNPNLSQIPKRHPVLGKLVRSLFIPEQGQQWFKGDLSQQEPRIGIHYAYILKMSGSAAVRQMYLDNPATDYHNMVMDLVNSVRTNNPITRENTKEISLGKMYGIGVDKMAHRLRITRNEVKSLLNSYDEGFPFIKELFDYCMQVANERGFVRTILGRKRRFDFYEPVTFQRGKFPIKGKKAAQKAYGYVKRASLHKAMNSVIQGSAAEQMKKALVMLHKEKINLLVTLYDEVGASVGSEKEAKIIKEIMENAIPFEVPHLMDYKLLPNWGG